MSKMSPKFFCILLILFVISTITSPVPPKCDNEFVHKNIDVFIANFSPNVEIEFLKELKNEKNICETKFRIPWEFFLGYSDPTPFSPNVMLKIISGDVKGAKALYRENFKEFPEGTLPRIIEDSWLGDLENKPKNKSLCPKSLNENLNRGHWRDLVKRGMKMALAIGETNQIRIVLKNVNLPNTEDLIESVQDSSQMMADILIDDETKERSQIEVTETIETGKDPGLELSFNSKKGEFKFVLKFYFDEGKIYPMMRSINENNFLPGILLLDWVVLFESNNLLINGNELMATLDRGADYTVARFESPENVDKSRGISYVWFGGLKK